MCVCACVRVCVLCVRVVCVCVVWVGMGVKGGPRSVNIWTCTYVLTHTYTCSFKEVEGVAGGFSHLKASPCPPL